MDRFQWIFNLPKDASSAVFFSASKLGMALALFARVRGCSGIGELGTAGGEGGAERSMSSPQEVARVVFTETKFEV